MLYPKCYNSPEARKKRSERGTKAVTIRWERHNAEQADEPVRTDDPADMFRLTWANLITGKTVVVVSIRGHAEITTE